MKSVKMYLFSKSSRTSGIRPAEYPAKSETGASLTHTILKEQEGGTHKYSLLTLIHTY